MLTVIAKIKANQNSLEKVNSELQKLVEPTRNENGCIDYILHQDNDDPSIFIFYENWETSVDLDAHMESEHFLECFKNIQGMFELDVNKLTKI